MVSIARPAVGLLAAASTWRLAEHLQAPAVRAWSLPAGRRTVAGGLGVRVHGEGERVLLLLHGLAARGDFFGEPFNGLGAQWTVVAPDLLGFGASRAAAAPQGYGLSAHLAALRHCLADLGLGDRRTVVVGHSMGANLALHVAARRAEQVDGVVSFSAPLFSSLEQARLRMRAMGRLEALFTRDDRASSAVCAWMCEHRALAGWLAVAAHPELPLSLARTGVQHTYAAFRGAFDEIVAGQTWRDALGVLEIADVPVRLVNGMRDPVPVPCSAEQLASTYANVEASPHPNADHGLPLAYPDWCVRQIRALG